MKMMLPTRWEHNAARLQMVHWEIRQRRWRIAVADFRSGQLADKNYEKRLRGIPTFVRKLIIRNIQLSEKCKIKNFASEYTVEVSSSMDPNTFYTVDLTRHIEPCPHVRP